MNIDNIKTIAVIGAGDMGHGIAEVALIAGYKVFLRDINQEFVDRGVGRINASLEKLVSKGKVPADHFEKIKNELMVPCTDLEEAVKEVDLVIEAIPEIMDLKKETFKTMDAAAPAHTIFASNTSTMKITEIASATNRTDKVLGLHYFNPAVIMKLVEVIKGDKTTDETMQIGYDFVMKINKVPVKVHKDVPGFIVNRCQAPSGVLLGCILDKKLPIPKQWMPFSEVWDPLWVRMKPWTTPDSTSAITAVPILPRLSTKIFAQGKPLPQNLKPTNWVKKPARVCLTGQQVARKSMCPKQPTN